MNIQKTSSRAVIAKVYRDLNLKEENRWTDMVEWIGEAFEHIGYFAQFENKTTDPPIKIENFRGRLPCDIHKLIQIEFMGVPMHESGSTFLEHYPVKESIDRDVSRYAHYRIDDPWIKTSFQDGEIVMAYQAFPIDDEGFPLIPDEVSFKEACSWYIIMKMMLGGFVHPNREIGYTFAESRWHHYCGQARAKGYMPDLGKMELIRKTLIRLVPQISMARNFFTDQIRDDTLLRRE